MDQRIAAAFQPYLRPGERIIWTGSAPRGIVLNPFDIFLVPFTLVWGGTAIFSFGAGFAAGARFFPFDAVGLLFLIVGLYLIIGRFLHDAWIRSRTAYALTNRRALVLRRILNETLLTAGLDNVSVSRGRAGRGTLEFDRKHQGFWADGMSWGRGFSYWTPSLSKDVRFVNIPDVMGVYELVQRQSERAAAP